MSEVAEGPGWWIRIGWQVVPARDASEWNAAPAARSKSCYGHERRTSEWLRHCVVGVLTDHLSHSACAGHHLWCHRSTPYPKSRGTQSGDGFALASLIIGLVELIISLVVVTIVAVLIASGSFSGLGQHDLAISGASGYSTNSGESGRPLAEGIRGGVRGSDRVPGELGVCQYSNMISFDRRSRGLDRSGST